jgi:hypothetical protein
VLPKLCVGSFSGKFASGQAAKLVIARNGRIQLLSAKRIFPATGTCELVSNTKASLSFTLSDDSNYTFDGSISKSGTLRTVVLKELKAGRVIDRLNLK